MVRFLVVFVFVFTVGFFVQSHFISDEVFNKLILNTYIFNFIFSLSISVSFHFLNKKDNAQLGFIYLFSVAFKLILYFILFKNQVLTITLTVVQRVSLLIPIALFLFLEALFVIKIITDKNHYK